MTDDKRSNFNLDSAAAQSAHTFWACILEPSAYQAVKDDYKSCEPHMQDWVNKRFDTLVKGHTRGYMLGYAAGRESMRAEIEMINAAKEHLHKDLNHWYKVVLAERERSAELIAALEEIMSMRTNADFGMTQVASGAVKNYRAGK